MVLRKTSNLCYWGFSSAGRRYSRMEDDSSGSWWKYAIGVVAVSGIVYMIMKNSKSCGEDDDRTLPGGNIPSSPFLRQCDCSDKDGTVEGDATGPGTEDEATQAEATADSACENTNENSKDVPSGKRVNERIRKAQLPYPPLFGSIPNNRQLKAIQDLANQLQSRYLSFQSLNYFYYVFGGKGLPQGYEPNDKDRINFLGTISELRCLILLLYRPAGKPRLNKGTWATVEECFLFHGEPIPSGSLKKQTNKIPEHIRIEIAGILSKIYDPTANGQVLSDDFP